VFKENVSRARCSENFTQCICPVVAKVIGDDPNSSRKTRGQCALGSVLKSGDRFHKSTRNEEWRHAHVDIQHYLSDGRTNAEAVSPNGVKHLTEADLMYRLPLREKVAIIPASNCRSGDALPNDEVEGRDQRLEVPPPLAQVFIAVSVQNRIGMVLRGGRGDCSPSKLLRIQGVAKGDPDLIRPRNGGGRCLFIGVVDLNLQGLLQLAY